MKANLGRGGKFPCAVKSQQGRVRGSPFIMALSVRQLPLNVRVAAGFGQTACCRATLIGHPIQGAPCNMCWDSSQCYLYAPGKHTQTLVQSVAFGGKWVGSRHTVGGGGTVRCTTEHCRPTNVSSHIRSVITLNCLIKIYESRNM